MKKRKPKVLYAWVLTRAKRRILRYVFMQVLAEKRYQEACRRYGTEYTPTPYNKKFHDALAELSDAASIGALNIACNQWRMRNKPQYVHID